MSGAAKRASGGYQAWIVGLLSLNFGILFFDRNALNFLMPYTCRTRKSGCSVRRSR